MRNKIIERKRKAQERYVIIIIGFSNLMDAIIHLLSFGEFRGSFTAMSSEYALKRTIKKIKMEKRRRR
jgi:hypothetical protein